MPAVRKIAVLGAGNGGFMCAADMGLAGYEVALFSRNMEKIRGVKERGGIEILDIESRPTGQLGRISCVTDDIGEAIRGAQVVLNPVPFFVCEQYAELAAAHLEEGQVVLYLGKGGASLTWARVLRERGIKTRVFLADCNTLPYGASRKGEDMVRLESRVFNLIIATFPGRDIDAVASVVQSIFPAYSLRRARNAVDTILVDYNAITHTAPMICNAGRIESGDQDFHLFGRRENTPAVVRLIERVDRERMAIGRKLDLEQYPLEEEILMVKWNPHGEQTVLPLYDAIHTPFLEVCEGPFTLETRHLTEDVPYGLVTYSSLGGMLGVPTPVSDALITMAEGLLDRDFRSAGRTVQSMGFDPNWSVEQLKRFLHDGSL